MLIGSAGFQAATKPDSDTDAKRRVEHLVGQHLKLTNADKRTLAITPETGWFHPFDLPHIVRCSEYRCERLEQRGMLISRVVGKYPDLRREYSRAD